MSSDALTEWMKRQGLAPIDVSLICGVSDRSVRSWMSGRHPIPRSVALITQAVDDGRIDLLWLAMAVGRIEAGAA